MNGNLTFGLVADIHQHIFFIHLNDFTEDHFTFLNAFQAFFIHLHEVIRIHLLCDVIILRHHALIIVLDCRFILVACCLVLS